METHEVYILDWLKLVTAWVSRVWACAPPGHARSLTVGVIGAMPGPGEMIGPARMLEISKALDESAGIASDWLHESARRISDGAKRWFSKDLIRVDELPDQAEWVAWVTGVHEMMQQGWSWLKSFEEAAQNDFHGFASW